MGSRAHKLAGRRFKALKVIRLAGKAKSGNLLWLCRCDCGNEVVLRQSALEFRGQDSCGCLSMKRLSERSTTHGATKGHQRTREYKIWEGMKRRCLYPDEVNYKNYGGRGIKICHEWRHSFPTFLADMGPCPAPGFSIERKNNDGDYSKENCYWCGSRKVQMRNRRNTRKLTIGGITKPVAQWAEENGLSYNRLYWRMRSGFPESIILSPASFVGKHIKP